MRVARLPQLHSSSDQEPSSQAQGGSLPQTFLSLLGRPRAGPRHHNQGLERN